MNHDPVKTGPDSQCSTSSSTSRDFLTYFFFSFFESAVFLTQSQNIYCHYNVSVSIVTPLCVQNAEHIKTV